MKEKKYYTIGELIKMGYSRNTLLWKFYRGDPVRNKIRIFTTTKTEKGVAKEDLDEFTKNMRKLYGK